MHTIRPLPSGQPILPRGRFNDLAGVEEILAGIDLSAGVLEAAVRIGLRDYMECTPHDPDHLPSVILSGKTARSLSDLLVEPHGWRHRSYKGQTAVVHPSGLVAVVVSMGDAKTGLFTETPSTSVAKGVTAEALIQDTQRRLFASPNEITGTPIGCLLLLHVFDNAREQVVNVEFSVPERMDEDGKISDWRTRLILPRIPFGRNLNQLVNTPAPAPQQPVEVQRKPA